MLFSNVNNSIIAPFFPAHQRGYTLYDVCDMIIILYHLIIESSCQWVLSNMTI